MDLKQFRALAGVTLGASASYEPALPDALSVSQLNEHVKRLLSGSALLSDVTVRGEISNFTAHRSGHFYFSLKDEGGLIRAVMFHGSNMRLSFLPENGMKVLARGSVSVYVRDGQYQLYVNAMDPDGIGSLYLAFEQRKRRLEAEGLFDPTRKKPIPKMPSRIGVITSPTGAAVRDILNILCRRYPCASVLLYPALVQGEDAPRTLVAGIDYFNENQAADVIIIGRGGGSMEDLFAFNDEMLARRIATSSIPVISAVGHETDFTIADFVADLRAPTPSAAAEIAVPDAAELLLRLQTAGSRLRAHLLATVTRHRKQFSSLVSRTPLRRPETLFDDARLSLSHSTEALCRAGEGSVLSKKTTFREMTAKLNVLSPLSVLCRGFSAAFDDKNRLISSVATLQKGENFRLRFHDGTLLARAEGILTLEADSQNQQEKRNVNETTEL